MSPRPGPRRPLFAARVDAEDVTWAEQQARKEGIPYADFVRRVVSFSRMNMPLGWEKPDENDHCPADPS